MIDRLIDRPTPMPALLGRDERLDSWAATSVPGRSGYRRPRPRTISPPRSAVEMVMTRRSTAASASTALRTRLMTTCWTWTLSIRTLGQAGAQSQDGAHAMLLRPDQGQRGRFLDDLV